MGQRSLLKRCLHQTRSYVLKPRTSAIVVTMSGCKRTGPMYYRRPAASFWQSRDKSRSSLTPQLKRGPGSHRSTQRMTARLCVTYVPRQGRASMLITGEWQVCDDGMMRPLVRTNVFGIDGSPVADDFLM